MYEILSSPALQAYNREFSTLILPQRIAGNAQQHRLTLPYYEGKTFNDAWTPVNGGAPMNLGLVPKMPCLLQDLAKVDISHVVNSPDLAAYPKVVFDHQEALTYFSHIADQFKESGLLTAKAADKIKTLLAIKQTTPMILNNGDFYPRNFINLTNGRIVLIDWETWNDNSPFYIIDHLENAAAVLYVHMWGNPAWQARYLAELSKLFRFPKQCFDKAVIMKALTLGYIFGKHKPQLKGQLEIIQQTLSGIG